MSILDARSVLFFCDPSRVLLCPLCFATQLQNRCGVPSRSPLAGLRVCVGVVGWSDYFFVTNLSDLRLLRTHNRRNNRCSFLRWRI